MTNLKRTEVIWHKMQCHFSTMTITLTFLNGWKHPLSEKLIVSMILRDDQLLTNRMLPAQLVSYHREFLCLPNAQENFPSPEELANVDVNYLASRCKLGFRSQWIVPLAQDIVEHNLQFGKLEEICNGSTLYSYDKLDKELFVIHGFDPFTRAYILMCMGFYHKIPSDSETIRHLKQFHSIKNCTVRTSRKNLEAIYLHHSNSWHIGMQFLAFLFFLCAKFPIDVISFCSSGFNKVRRLH
ncbi:hypothetical protein B296_00010127 [Ensete ventricosum]|uniref:Uncharacterized protein n=1 Tax=Ensete ventricosum TaxID=4639 RepID=A0A426ZGY6_ENSVE|nr:hypothetical protein B296_00010127 [Ensete ventricosum]